MFFQDFVEPDFVQHQAQHRGQHDGASISSKALHFAPSCETSAYLPWSWSFTWAGGGKRIKKVFCGKKQRFNWYIYIYWYDLAFTAWHITKPATIAFWKYCGFCCDWSGLPALVPKMQENHGPPRQVWERQEPFDFFFWGSSWLWKCSII